MNEEETSRTTSDLNLQYDKLLGFDELRLESMGEIQPFHEFASGAFLEIYESRDNSEDLAIRNRAHFENRYSTEIGRLWGRPIPDNKLEEMKVLGYRLLEFDRHNWEIVKHALQVFKKVFGHLDIPNDFIVNDDILEMGMGFDESIQDLPLGMYANMIRIGE
jgi:hypothetical protein